MVVSRNCVYGNWTACWPVSAVQTVHLDSSLQRMNHGFRLHGILRLNTWLLAPQPESHSEGKCRPRSPNGQPTGIPRFLHKARGHVPRERGLLQDLADHLCATWSSSPLQTNPGTIDRHFRA